MWFDSHCHLHICEERSSVAELLERAHSVGVDSVVTVGIDAPSNRRSLEIAREHEGVFASVGIHPNDSSDWGPEHVAQLESFAREPEIVAIGESGLDFYRDRAPAEKQAEAFRAHIDLARRHDKALIIHTRESVDASLDVLESEGPLPRFVFHCWSGDPGQLQRAAALGAWVSFAGNVSFKNAENLREVARLVSADRLLVETDSPYLTPVPRRGEPNEPGNVALVGAAVAAARGEDPDQIARQTTENARRLFALT